MTTESPFIRFVRWLAFTACFLAFPLILGNVGVRHAFETQWQTYVERLAEQRLRLHDRLITPSEDRSFFYHELTRLTQCLERSGEDYHSILNRLENLQKLVPGLFDLYVTDASGELLYPAELPVTLSRFAVKKLHTGLEKALAIGAPRPLHKHQKLFNYFWGETIVWGDLSRMHDVRELLEVSPMGRRSFFYYRFTRYFALFAHVNLQAVPTHFPLRVLASRAEKRSRRMHCGVAGVGESINVPALTPAERQFIERGLVEFESSPREYFVQGDNLLVVTSINPSFRLWSLTKLNARHRGDLTQRRLLVYSIIVFLFSALTGWMVIFGQAHVELSIRKRLIGVLVFAIGLPLVVIAVMGYDYLGKTEQTMIYQAYRHLEDSIRSFDEKFPQLYRQIQQRIKQAIKRHQTSDGGFDLAGFNADILGKQKELGFFWHLIVNAEGETLYFSHDKKGQSRDDMLSYSVTTELLRRLNRSLGFVDTQKTAGRGSTSVFMADDRNFKYFMSQSMKRFNQFNRHFDRIYLFEPVFGPNGRADLMIFFNFRPRDLFFLYLQQNLLGKQSQVANSRIFAVFAEATKFDVPSECGKLEWLRQFVGRTTMRKTMVKERFLVDGDEVLAAAALSQHGDGYCLVQIVPVAEVIRGLSTIRWNLGLFIGISLLMVMAVGSVLARHFLLPIQELSAGVLAIQESRFRYRIPTRSRDELGQLSQMFNRTLEQLEELSLARTVQGRLFPPSGLEHGDWRVFGRCLTATELGGDYYDYFLVGDEHIVVVIGDVAGHGTSAALLMAMAKAGLTLEAKRDVSPAHVLGELNALLYSSDKRRKLLTLFYAVIDVANGKVRYGNAGHNRPILFPRGGKPVELSSHGFPLGSRRQVEYRDECVTMAAGDRLWLYTDGIPETPGRDQEPLGYERMSRLFAETGVREGEAAVNQVFQCCEQFRAGQPQADDMTLILVERLPRG